MLNNRYVSVSGLDIFRNEILSDSIALVDSATPVPAGTVPSPFITYYERSGSGTEADPYVYTKASVQPTGAVPANTYWTLDEGSPSDVTRGASVKAISQYVNSKVTDAVNEINNYIEGTVGRAIDSKVSSVSFDNSTKAISYQSVSESTDPVVVTFSGGGATTLSASNGTLTISSSDTLNTSGSTEPAVSETGDLYIVGAFSQGANPQTYSRSGARVDKDGYLFSNGVKVNMTGLATETYVNQQISAAIGAAIAAAY